MKRLKRLSIKPPTEECIMSKRSYMFEISVTSSYVVHVDLPDDVNLQENLEAIQEEIEDEFAYGNDIELELKDENDEEFVVNIESINDMYSDMSDVTDVYITDIT